jgi:hypothetical protein
MTEEWIVIDQKNEEVFFYSNFDTMIEESESPADDVRWQLKRTGRFDSADGEITIINRHPEKED